MSNASPTKVIIPCRISYAHIFEPTSVNGSEPKFSASLIVSKKDVKTITAIQKAIEQAKKDSLGKWGGKIPSNLKIPLRDGDTDRSKDEAYAGCFFLNANSRQAPQVVDRKVQPILDQSEVYSGCYCNVSVTFYGYNSNGDRGIAAGLGNVQFVKDGEALGGRSKASDDFEVMEDEEDDFLA